MATRKAVSNEVIDPVVPEPTNEPVPMAVVATEGPYDYEDRYDQLENARRAATMAVLTRPTKAEEIKTRSGGRSGELRYISGDTVIKRLIEATGGHYTVDLVPIGANEQTVIFFEESTAKGMKKNMLVCVSLSVPNLGTKIGFGIQTLQGGEDMYKGALTDGLKKAATQLGVGLDLYDESYSPEEEPVVVSIKAQVTSALKTKGIKTKADANVAANERYGVDYADVTEAQLVEWFTELQKAPF